MEPYQRASAAIRSGEEKPLHLLKQAGLTAIGGGAASLGAKAANSLVPAIGALINQYVPDNIAKAGLSKVDPRMGKFLQGATDAGYGFKELRKFLGEKIEKTEESKQDKNIIERVSPELHSFMSDQIKQGRNGYQAGAIAQKDKRFASVIDKLQKEHKVSWADIIDQIYGQGIAPKKQGGMMQQESDRFNQQYPQQQAPSGSPEQAPNFSGQPQGQNGPGPKSQALAQAIMAGTEQLKKLQG